MSKPSADEDDMLLSQLTEAELAELNEIFDPDVSVSISRFILSHRVYMHHDYHKRNAL